MSMSAPAYPIGLEIDDPAKQSRLTVFFRLLMVIPHAIILIVLGLVSSLITFVAWLVILFTGKYPAGMMDFVINVQHWSARFAGYAWLLTGVYPPFAMGPNDSYPIRLSVQGQLEGRNRLTVFFRYFMAIPHLIILYFLFLAAEVVLLISWVAALFTGSVPAGLHTFLGGILRWQTRLTLYQLLITDQYPPFSLS